MPGEKLGNWERGDRVLQAYEKINADPGMVYVTDKNSSNVTRIIADLLHYCTYQNSRVGTEPGRHMDIDTVMEKARAIYAYEQDRGQ